MTHEQFTQIYLPFSGKMYALAYNLLRNRDEARDCVQRYNIFRTYASIMAEIELGNVVFDGFEGRGIANVKECSMFPRDINRVAP